MSEHTKGRLVKDYGGTIGHIKAVPDEAAQGITPTPTLFRYDTCADTVNDQREANARRLVACWNACEGIKTEALEQTGTITHKFEREYLGMSLRDYFAGQAIGIFQRKVIIEVTAHDGGCTPKQIGDALCEQVAESAYLIADAMLKARTSTP